MARVGEDGFNTSLLNPIPGAVVFFVLGLLLGEFTVGYLGNDTPLFLAKLVIGLASGAVYYALCIQPETGTGKRGVVYLFTNQRWRIGPQGLGFTEGLNATPLPKGVMTVRDEIMQERTMDLGEVDEFTSNDVVASAFSSCNWRILDPYQWQNMEKGDESLRNLVLQSCRDLLMTHRSHATRQDDGVIIERGIIDENKSALADGLRDVINAALKDNRVNPMKNSQLTDEVVEVLSFQIKKVDLPEPVKKALAQRETEPVERQGERVQALSRQEQVNILATTPGGQSSGIDRQMAYLGSLADAGKQGVNLNHLSLAGTITDSIAAIGTNIERGLMALANSRNVPPPAPPAGGTRRRTP